MANNPDYASIGNIELIEGLYRQYQKDPKSVDPSWQRFFEGLDFAGEFPRKGPIEIPSDLRVDHLVKAYRTYGHLAAEVNPVAPEPLGAVPQLDLKQLGFSREDLSREFPTHGLLPKENAPLSEILESLKGTYCGRIGFEVRCLGNPELERYLQERIEGSRGRPQLSLDQKRMVLQYLNKAELFEIFLHTKYVGQKRFSLEGGEATIPLLRALIELGAEQGLREFVIGIAHRGRLNVLTNILGKSHRNIFHEFEDTLVESSFQGSGDVKYHKGFSADVETPSGAKVHLSLAANPSHLESVDPVAQGQCRAKQVLKGDGEAKKRIAPITIHGDAAVAGQGVVYETMQMGELSGYGVGGTLHLVINNQIGFTTLPKDSRSTHYCTDIAKAFGAPVFHVNGEDAEGCFFAAQLAIEIRQKFGCDVFIDLNCYRKYGHNEGDEPAYTQPLEYQRIREKQSVRVIYRDDLIQQGVVERKMAEALEEEFRAGLQRELEEVQSLKTEPTSEPNRGDWQKYVEENRKLDPFATAPTAVPEATLKGLAERLCHCPDGFNLHRKVVRLLEERQKMAETGEAINWGMAELLAYASLIAEGTHIRLSGQDSRRGTFSHRHAMWFDQQNTRKYCPLNHIAENQGRFDLFNSPLSEYAALGFEYGYSTAYPGSLVIWEAQFGDFANGAQIIVDQYLSTSEQKWNLLTGLTLFLPHGYEGQGPEHSSARMERYLQLAGDDNMRICYPSTPAQHFHLLRRQVRAPGCKPLIVFTPKSLLGNPKCVSSLSELSQGQFFPILDDPTRPKNPHTLVLCSGKVYYDLIEKKGEEMALVRIEQLYPLDKGMLEKVCAPYKGAKRLVYCQEEPENMGAWDYLRPLLRDVFGRDAEYVGRNRSASPATGSPKKHKAQLAEIMNKLFKEA
ncbi:MAG: 2-oxoglutarate dehydrogenase E1 component [Parachlamydiales bacterium]